MKKKMVSILLALSLSVFLTACNNDSEKPDNPAVAESKSTPSEIPEHEQKQKAEPLVLTGTWESENKDGSYQEAIISDSTISVNWVSDDGATTSIYWIGTYTAPSSNSDEYSWTSERDKEKTDSAIMASSDDTKDFTYKDGKISYSVSLLGTTTTCELTKVSDEIPESSKEDTQVSESQKSEEVPGTTEKSSSTSENSQYDITNQNISFYTDEYGDIYAKAIVEVTNTGKNNLYLDYSSYELISDARTVIHTTSGSFTPYPKVIAPGEKGYYYDYVPMDAGTPTNGISITPHIEAETATIDNTLYDVSATEMYDKEYGGFDIHGLITNPTDTDGELVTVAAVLFDSNQQPIGVLDNILSSVKSGESIGFELESYSIPDNITTSMISDYKVFAYPEQYQ